jgi:general stress protein CsbA
MLVNLFVPLAAGGIFCIILVYHHIIYLVAPATLLFYGLGLINASKYTFREIKYLGLTEIILGLVASVFIGYGLIFWAFGFGILHIVYGIFMYRKHERKTSEEHSL